MRSPTEHLRIASLTHSTNPRGGVVHAMELGEALHDLGHQVVVHAPDPSGRGFPRPLRCGAALVSSRPAPPALGELVRQRIDEYVSHFQNVRESAFDIYHAQDGISANALATLAERGQIPGFVRTVHHLDDFFDPYLRDRQDRSVRAASRVICVSQMWRKRVESEYGLPVKVIPNGVNSRRFSPSHTGRDPEVRERLGISSGPVFLAVGGVEPRKNTVRILLAFLQILRDFPTAQLVIAGGASLLDHSAYRVDFDARVRSSRLGGSRSLILTGVLPDEDMPALFRAADALVFPSIKEGFGLVVLEALASAIPVIAPRIEPFTEYLADGDCIWCDPTDAASIATAMADACRPEVASPLRGRGPRIARRFSWDATARMHAIIYHEVKEEMRNARDAIPCALA